MYIATGADLIFYKSVTNGTLYVLKFKKENEKQHTTVNNYIMQLDENLKLSAGRDATYFLSINNDDTLSGSKVLSFDRVGRKSDPLYRQLFGGKNTILAGVSVWKKDIGDAAELSEDDALNGSSGEDEEVSGGIVTAHAPSSKGKQRAIEYSNEPRTSNKKRSFDDAIQGGSVLQAEKVIFIL
jgi:hypothetical protein